MAFTKKVLPICLAILMMGSPSYGEWGDQGIELEDSEVCYIARYTMEKNIVTIEKEYEKFKTSELEKCKNEREKKILNKKIQKNIEPRINYTKNWLKDHTPSMKMLEEGNFWMASQLRQQHNDGMMENYLDRPSPLVEIKSLSFDINGTVAQYERANQITDIELVMEAFENAEKEKQLAEEKKARDREARKIERERKQAEKDMLAAQKRLEEQKAQDVRNAQLRAEAEELNRQTALKQAEQEELKRLEAVRAELAAARQELEAAKIRAEMEAKNRAEAEELNRLKTQALAEQAELARLEAQKDEVSALKQKMEAEEIRAKEEAKHRAEREAILKQKEELRSQEAQQQAKIKAEQEEANNIQTALAISENYKEVVLGIHQEAKTQIEFGTPEQKLVAGKVLNYTTKALDLLNEGLDICYAGKRTGNYSKCQDVGTKSLVKAEYLIQELLEKMEAGNW